MVHIKCIFGESMMKETATNYALRARAEKLARAHANGIDDALISTLVEHFYAAIRDDDLLGPIFARKIAHWDPHLARMKDFWASVTIESGRFRGNPMLKHIAIGGLDAAHFDRWLALWDESLRQLVINPEAAEQFRSAAQRIARSLVTGILLEREGLSAITSKGTHKPC